MTRQDTRPKWPQYFLGIAKAVEMRSGDPDGHPVGAVITTADNVLVATGYNGFAREVEPHSYRSSTKIERLRWMCHAERNAIYNAARTGVSVQGGTIYSTRFPCLACAHAIIQSGLKKVVTADSKPYRDELLGDNGSRVFDVFREAGIQVSTPGLERTRTTVARRKAPRKPGRRKGRAAQAKRARG
jgi:dCMP deaminase